MVAADFVPDAKKPKYGKDIVGFISNIEDDFEAVSEDNSEPFSEDDIFMPKRVNIHEAGLCLSDKIRQNKEK